MGKILVTYDSGYGATAIVGEIIAETLAEKGLEVDLRPVGGEDLSGYDTLLLGSPIRLGRCTSKIKQFLRNNLNRLTSMQVAFFFTCMSVTHNACDLKLPLYVDPSFDYPDKPQARIRMMENNHTVSYYLKHFLKLIPGITSVGIAFFKGRLQTANLTPLHTLIMRLAMFSLPEIQNGDLINPVVVRDWAAGLCSRMEIA